jgi:hypothetical protein
MISKNKTAATPMYQVIQELFLFFCKLLIKDFYFIDVGFITAINYTTSARPNGMAGRTSHSRLNGMAGRACTVTCLLNNM